MRTLRVPSTDDTESLKMCRKTVVKQELEFFDFDNSSVEYPVTKQSRNFTSLFISQCICRDAVIEVMLTAVFTNKGIYLVDGGKNIKCWSNIKYIAL